MFRCSGILTDFVNTDLLQNETVTTAADGQIARHCH